MNDGIVTRNLSWKEMVQKSWGKEWNKPDIAYEFTRRKFNDRMQANAGDGLETTGQYADFWADEYA